jgi:hypothetical protein
MTALCLFLGWRTYYESKFQRINSRLNELNLHAITICEDVPRWRLALFGAAVHTRIDSVYLYDEHFDKTKLGKIVDLLNAWGGVRELRILSPVSLRQDQCAQISRLTALEKLAFDNCEGSDAFAMAPIARLPHLSEISIETTSPLSSSFPLDFYLSLPNLKVLGLPSWSEETHQYVARKRPDLNLVWTDAAP